MFLTLRMMEAFHDSEYDVEIFQYLMKKERELMPGPRLLSNSDVPATSRAWVLDWTIRLHSRYILSKNSAFLAANYLDRLLSVYEVSPGQLQLFAAVAVVVATKYDNHPSDTLSLSDIEAEMNYNYDIETLKYAERCILHRLCYELGWPTPLDFLRRTCRATGESAMDSALAEGLATATISDERFLHIPPSYIAASSLLLVRKMKSLKWVSVCCRLASSSPNELQTSEHVDCTTYPADQLKYTASLISQCWVGKFGKGQRRY